MCCRKTISSALGPDDNDVVIGLEQEKYDRIWTRFHAEECDLKVATGLRRTYLLDECAARLLITQKRNGGLRFFLTSYEHY